MRIFYHPFFLIQYSYSLFGKGIVVPDTKAWSTLFSSLLWCGYILRRGGTMRAFSSVCFMCDFTPQPIYLINLWNALETKTSLLGQNSQNQLSDCYQGSDCKVNNKHSTSWALFPGSCLRFKVIISVDLKKKKRFLFKCYGREESMYSVDPGGKSLIMGFPEMVFFLLTL